MTAIGCHGSSTDGVFLLCVAMVIVVHDPDYGYDFSSVIWICCLCHDQISYDRRGFYLVFSSLFSVTLNSGEGQRRAHEVETFGVKSYLLRL
jgi:hypothetical protein